MAFQVTQNPMMNQGGEQKKKSNFRINRVYGSDGQIDVSVWNSDKGGCYTILSMKAAIGKDPTTGSNVYEQKMSGELPSICMNSEILFALLEAVKDADPATLNASVDTKRGAKMSIVGQGTSIKITVDNTKTGSRTITLDAVPVGTKNIHANWELLKKFLSIGLSKSIHNKLDPEEFAMAVASDEENSDM